MIPRRGATLMEAVLSLFLLIAAGMLVVNLLHVSLRYQTRIQERVSAVLLAQTVLDRIRAWAWEQTGGTYNFHGDWSTYAGVDLTDPAYPGFTARVDVEPAGRTLFSPSSLLEQAYAPMPRALTRAVVPVRIRILRGGADVFSLVSHVGEPPLTLQPLQIVRVSGPGGAVPQDAILVLQAQASDPGGQVIQGLTYSWEAEPTGAVPGQGTLLQDTTGDGVSDMPRDGSQTGFQHRYRLSDGITWRHKAGQCRVLVRTIQHGQAYRGEIVLDLDPGPLP